MKTGPGQLPGPLWRRSRFTCRWCWGGGRQAGGSQGAASWARRAAATARWRSSAFPAGHRPGYGLWTPVLKRSQHGLPTGGLVQGLRAFSGQLLHQEHEQRPDLRLAAVEEGLVADLPFIAQLLKQGGDTCISTGTTPDRARVTPTWQAWARLMPTLKRADMPGGREVGSVAPSGGLTARMQRTTASTSSSLPNRWMLSTSWLTSLGGRGEGVKEPLTHTCTAHVNVRVRGHGFCN